MIKPSRGAETLVSGVVRHELRGLVPPTRPMGSVLLWPPVALVDRGGWGDSMRAPLMLPLSFIFDPRRKLDRYVHPPYPSCPRRMHGPPNRSQETAGSSDFHGKNVPRAWGNDLFAGI